MRRLIIALVGISLLAAGVMRVGHVGASSAVAYACEAPNGSLGAVTVNQVPTCPKTYSLASWPVTVTPATTTSTTTVRPAGTVLTFTTTNFPRRYGSCATVLSPTQLRFDLTSACDPAGDGHYRTDWSNIGTFHSGTTTCASIPVSFPNGVPSVGSGSWWQFAEAKTPTNANGWADWALYVANKAGGGTEFDFRMGWVTGTSTQGNGSQHPSLWHGGSPAAGPSTFVVCSNYSTTTNGFLDLYLNGVKMQSISGVFILKGQTSTDLDLNDYTGGSPLNVLVHGAPTISPTP